MKRISIITLFLSCLTASLYAGNVKIKITGTLDEPVTMVVTSPFGGSPATTMTISQLPCVFDIDKKLLPMTAKFSSPNFQYKDIVLNKNEEDGRVYVLHKKDVVQAIGTQIIQAPQQVVPQAPVNHTEASIDQSIDVNNVPVTKGESKNTFALIIANENYELANPVDMALNDGTIFKEYCVKTLGIPESCVKFYKNATYGQITKALKNMQSIAAAYEGDINLIVYYAGHGIPHNETLDAYLMPVDADGTDLDVCFSLKKFYKTIDDMKLSKAIVFLDACFSGAKRDGGMIVAARGVAIKPKASQPEGNTIVFSATSGEEPAFSYKEKQHGIFSYFLLKKLKETKGNVTLGELVNDVTRSVSQQSIVINGTPQTPNVIVPPSLQKSWKDLKLTNR